ncbi:glycosyltransferase family 4 protein [Haloferula rosea]|uniref:Glycosyltransferase family 4 protein n=1 Tax=Haloferula rosea TaxID=490093 RepID=A0A934RGC1_9BACT|nr:glycosyltransferase family 4 protein [Haloferula rosea]
MSLDLRRLDQFALGDGIAAVSPGALARYRRYVRAFGREELVRRLFLLPHPVSPDCTYEDGQPQKSCQVVAVGRWSDAAQKRPDLLMRVIEAASRRRKEYRFVIVGEPTTELEEWHRALPPAIRERVELSGVVAHEELVEVMKESRVLLVTSAFESFHISAAEALCCGATIVGSRSPCLPSLRWFTCGGSGTLAPKLGAEELGRALTRELAEWEHGTRCPATISRRWGDQLHSDQVAAKVITWSKCSS